MARAKRPVEVDPNKLKRERAGRYVTPDGRFAVEGPSTNGWYVIDAERENELGLPLMAGPFATLDEARDEVATIRGGGGPTGPTSPTTEPADGADGARTTDPDRGAPTGQGPRAAATEPKPSNGRRPAVIAAPDDTEPDARTTDEPGPPAPPEPESSPGAGAHNPPPKRSSRRSPATAARTAVASAVTPDEPGWLQRLEADDRDEARRLLRILDAAGVDDPALVRRQLEANLPEVARLLLAMEIRQHALDPWRDPVHLAAQLKEVSVGLRRHLRPLVEPSAEAATRALTSARKAGSEDALAAFAWLVALRTAAAVFEVLDAEGRATRTSGEPGWRLVETDGRRTATSREVAIETADLLEAPNEG